MDRDKMCLYQSIVSQLEDDGFYGAASAVAQTAMVPSARQEKDALAKLVSAGQRAVQEAGEITHNQEPGGWDAGDADGDGAAQLDLANAPAAAARVPNFGTKFITTHKAACRVAKFNPDGSLVATGSADTSIKLLSVAQMLSYGKGGRGSDSFAGGVKPVLKTLYNHTQPVADLDWHPFMSVLLSCGKDNMIKFFDCSKTNQKHPYQSIQDTHSVLSAAFHPSGDFVMAGTEHNMVRIFDVRTLQCYTPSSSSDHHTSGINQVRCALDGKQYATAGKDGDVKLWDVVTNSCVATLAAAHDKMEVTSVTFCKSQKYLLTAGRNNQVVLWDLTARRPLVYYSGHRHTRHRSQACFSFNEEHVITSDDAGPDVVIWNARSGDLVQRVSAGHAATVRWVASSPTAANIVTCSDDNRCRFWTST